MISSPGLIIRVKRDILLTDLKKGAGLAVGNIYLRKHPKIFLKSTLT